MRTSVRNRRRPPVRLAFTLVELLTATALALVMMLILANVFGQVTGAINEQRAAIEMRQQLRTVADRLRQDLEGITVRMRPPVNPAWNEGYFEYVEGPYGPIYWPQRPTRQILTSPLNLTQNANGVAVPSDPDTTLGDLDDILAFTTRTRGEPFRGRQGFRHHPSDPTNMNVQRNLDYTYRTMLSDTAEVAWFVRGNVLYRRVLLVGSSSPGGVMSGDAKYFNRYFCSPPISGFGIDTDALDFCYYRDNDFSVREEGVGGHELTARAGDDLQPRLVLNTLGDLTKREHRYAHQPFVFPHDVRDWGLLGLPTIGECSDPRFPLPQLSRHSGDVLSSPDLPLVSPIFSGSTRLHRWNTGYSGFNNFDARTRPYPYGGINVAYGDLSRYVNHTVSYGVDPLDPTRRSSARSATRSGEDIVLRNVLSFDVKAWDPGAPLFRGDTQPGAPLIRQGDPGYLERLRAAASGGSAAPVAYGSFVDLNYMCLLGRRPGSGVNLHYPNYTPPAGAPEPDFHWRGHWRSKLQGVAPSTSFGVNPNLGNQTTQPRQYIAAVYDTGSSHYEADGLDQDGDGTTDEGANGVDDDGRSGIDDLDEREAPPPYAAQLRGIQIRIRVFEPDTQEIREVTVVQDFVPQ